MVTLSTAYSITIKVGEKLFAGHVDNSLSIVPNYEPILRKTLGGRFDLDFVGVDLDMQLSGLTYERTVAEAATHYDFAALRAACNSSASVTFVYGDITPGKVVLTGNAKLTDYQETAGSGKISGQWSCRLRSVRGSVLEEVVPPEVQDVKYGLLYNWYAASDIREICSAGWHIGNANETKTLAQYIEAGVSEWGGTVGKKLKEAGTSHWLHDNGINTFGFNGRGSGQRGYSNGSFSSINVEFHFWHAAESNIYQGQGMVNWIRDSMDFFNYCYSSSGTWYGSSQYFAQGYSLRPIKDSSSLSHGESGTYTGNDGKVYRTICIGTQEWLADNLCETLFRTGENIPEVTDNAAWAALTSAGMCAYNNDWSNV